MRLGSENEKFGRIIKIQEKQSSSFLLLSRPCPQFSLFVRSKIIHSKQRTQAGDPLLANNSQSAQQIVSALIGYMAS